MELRDREKLWLIFCKQMKREKTGSSKELKYQVSSEMNHNLTQARTWLDSIATPELLI